MAAVPSPFGPRARLWFRYGWAWLPFAFYWAALVLLDRGSVSAAFVAGVVMTTATALLGAGVWWLSGRHPWTGRAGLGWLLRQAGFALVFAGTLSVIDAALHAATAGRSLAAEVVAAPGTVLRGVLVYSWLYGLLAGVCYAIRAHLRLRAETLLSARAEAAASHAQLRALRAQLNPHFLFNALHSLGALVRQDPEAAEEAVERLGEMLRYALDDDADEEVLLADEWAFTRSYLAIEALRYGDRLRVQADLTPEALSCLVPVFVLQPLVENAVRHGIAPRTAGGCLFVDAAVEGEWLTIRVRDDGSGATTTSFPSCPLPCRWSSPPTACVAADHPRGRCT
jgi:signal transduction histidine kinase